MIELSDEDIRRRLTDIEDSTVERKTASDYWDCLKTAVAFSNSLPVGDPGIIFAGHNPQTIAQALGHQSARMALQFYGSVTDEVADRARKETFSKYCWL